MLELCVCEVHVTAEFGFWKTLREYERISSVSLENTCRVLEIGFMCRPVQALPALCFTSTQTTLVSAQNLSAAFSSWTVLRSFLVSI